MSRCRPCRSKRVQADRELLIARIVYWLPLLSDTELGAVASLAERLGRAAERRMKALDDPYFADEIAGPLLQCGRLRLKDCSPAVEDGCERMCDAGEALIL